MIARFLGPTGPRVSAIGLGAMGMSDRYDAHQMALLDSERGEGAAL